MTRVAVPGVLRCSSGRSSPRGPYVAPLQDNDAPTLQQGRPGCERNRKRLLILWCRAIAVQSGAVKGAFAAFPPQIRTVHTRPPLSLAPNLYPLKKYRTKAFSVYFALALCICSAIGAVQGAFASLWRQPRVRPLPFRTARC